MDPTTEKKLIQDAVGGDRAALQALLLAYYRSIEAAVRQRFSQELSAHLEVEDLIQEVLIDAHRGIKSFQNSDNGSFAAWIERLAKNRVVDTVRHYRAQKRGGDRQRVGSPPGPSHDSLDTIWKWVGADVKSPSREMRVKEAREMVQICLAGLNDDQRRAVSAYYFEQRRIEEIAQDMGRSPGAVRELLRRARGNLARLLGTASAWLSSR